MEISREYVIIQNLAKVAAELMRRQHNVLVDFVDGSPVACIADFSVATVTKDLDSTESYVPPHTPSVQWSAPEVLSGKRPTQESDVYSLAMVMIEVGRR